MSRAMTRRCGLLGAERVAFADWRLVNLLNGVFREGATFREYLSRVRHQWFLVSSLLFFFVCLETEDKCEKSDSARSPRVFFRKKPRSQTARSFHSADINVVIFYDTVTINTVIICIIIIEMYCKQKYFIFISGRESGRHASQVARVAAFSDFTFVDISRLIFCETNTKLPCADNNILKTTNVSFIEESSFFTMSFFYELKGSNFINIKVIIYIHNIFLII